MHSYLLFYFIFFIPVLYAQVEESKPDYLNNELSIQRRVDDLLSRMTLEEKASQMINSAKAIPRLQIPEYDWWNEGLHGVARAGVATVFPQAIVLSATWDTDLMFNVADVISTEARAKHHEFIRQGDRSIYKGLTYWSPNINIFRDPRWGRGQETYGEDPYLTSRMGVAFIKGLQGEDPKYLKLVATPKHYAVHSGPEPERHTFDAITNNRDLYETYLPAFEAAIKEANARSVMCAYNRFMGEACCGSPALLKKILRDDWGFDGYVVSDCGAIDDIFANHKIVETPYEAAALAIKSGTDLECGRVYEKAIIDAVNKNLLTEDDLDVSLKRLFTERFKLGMFDPPELVKYAQIPIEENDSEEHRKLSVTAARESIVLLKNSNNILPLKKDLKRIAVIGPTADSYQMLLGNYNGTPSKHVTPLQGIINKIGSETEVVFEKGCNLVEEGTIINNLSSNILSYESHQGLKAEYFNNTNLEGKPFFEKIDPLDNDNWIWGTRMPNLRNMPEYSIRWSGKINPPASGEYKFTLKGGNGYRIYIDSNLLIEDWNEHQFSSKSNTIHLEKENSYNIRIEFFKKSGRPELLVEWQLLNVDHLKKAIELASNSDVVIFVGGITPQLEGEEMRVDYEGFKGGDRTSLSIPKMQQDLLKAIHATGKPIVLVLTSGSALAVNWENENLPAIIQLWYPGQEGGTALADILFGDYNPGGRLPVTFYKSEDDLPPFEDYNMKGRTYRYFEYEPLFPFGYGLSYTKFSYSNLTVPDSINAGEELKVSVEVQNSGSVAGDEVVQLYIKDLEASVPVAIHSLQGFKRINLQPGEKQEVNFVVNPKQLAIIDESINRIVEPGMFEIFVGGIQPGYKAQSAEYISKKINVFGKPFCVE